MIAYKEFRTEWKSYLKGKRTIKLWKMSPQIDLSLRIAAMEKEPKINLSLRLRKKQGFGDCGQLRKKKNYCASFFTCKKKRVKPAKMPGRERAGSGLAQG